MKINRNHPKWQQAPWYVKFSCFGTQSIKVVNLFAHGSFIIAFCAFLAGYILISWLHEKELGAQVFKFSSIGIATYPYLLSIIWVNKNPEILE